MPLQFYKLRTNLIYHANELFIIADGLNLGFNGFSANMRLDSASSQIYFYCIFQIVETSRCDASRFISQKLYVKASHGMKGNVSLLNWSTVVNNPKSPAIFSPKNRSPNE